MRAMTNQTFDLIIRGGRVYDGSGDEPFVGDIAVDEDRVAVSA
jgi:N-acyl-D-amino-acid deacylase